VERIVPVAYSAVMTRTPNAAKASSANWKPENESAKTHVARLLTKLDARDRIQLLIRAHGLDGQL
jgi:hypothetical protein